MAYRALAMVLPGTELDLDRLAERLREKMRHIKVARSPRSLQMLSVGWALILDVVDDPYVRAESADIAQKFADERPDRELISLCACRIEVSADPDPTGEHFVDYVGTLDVLFGFGNVVLFDPATGTFL